MGALIDSLGLARFARLVKLKASGEDGPSGDVVFLDPWLGEAWALPIDELGTIGLPVQTVHPDKAKPNLTLALRLKGNEKLFREVLKEVEDLLFWEWEKAGVKQEVMESFIRGLLGGLE